MDDAALICNVHPTIHNYKDSAGLKKRPNCFSVFSTLCADFVNSDVLNSGDLGAN